MAEEKAKQFMESGISQDREVYCTNFQAHKPGISKEESTKVYDQWNSYDDDLNSDRYRGPDIVAKAVGEYFSRDRQNKLIIDVACGTGFVAIELKKLGFENIHGLDPSFLLLEKARQKNAYTKYYQCYLDDKRLGIDDGVYDCAVIAGGMGEGHIPTVGLYELARIVKPGGLICIVMREEYLEHVEDYRGRLENVMKDMEKTGKWKLLSRVVVPRYSFNNNGVVFKFVVC